MHKELTLDRIRAVLARLEETIIFALIERSQFSLNRVVYLPGALGVALGDRSLINFLLHGTEVLHSQLRRYTSSDEHPFFSDLPDPILERLDFPDVLVTDGTLNFNARIREVYEQHVVTQICAEGDDGQYGSSAVNDVVCLQALSKRIHYGEFVAESKFQAYTDRYAPLIAAGDREGLVSLLTDTEVEINVVQRVREKTAQYAGLIQAANDSTLTPEIVVKIYKDWVIPLNKEVQVEYLLRRPVL
ncbi:MAG: chorismate mutase [Kiritimatiellia bacterium]|jgi:chorismate mutase|nr:chorismate mutase [Kiritimatiellia bacterium]MDP6847640.1 chorismate mutase [Kiritimatiellia bacterium]